MGRDEPLHHLVHWRQMVLVVVDVPTEERHHVVAGFGLGFGRGGQREFAARTGDKVSGDLDLVLLGPGVDLFLHDVVGAGHPVVPKADIQLAGGAGSADMHERQCRSCGAQFDGLAARNRPWLRHNRSPCMTRWPHR
jgi:hypothetical protein